MIQLLKIVLEDTKGLNTECREAAAVLNYIPHLLSGEATPIETMAYCFDKVAKFTDGLPPEAEERVKKLGEKDKNACRQNERRLIRCEHL